MERTYAPRVLSGVELIAVERRRQIEVEGWAAEHDDEHLSGEMAAAAACYAFHAIDPDIRDLEPELAETSWPWDKRWWKPSSDPVRNLVKAGALIAAELDRLQRLAAKE